LAMLSRRVSLNARAATRLKKEEGQAKLGDQADAQTERHWRVSPARGENGGGAFGFFLCLRRTTLLCVCVCLSVVAAAAAHRWSGLRVVLDRGIFDPHSGVVGGGGGGSFGARASCGVSSIRNGFGEGFGVFLSGVETGGGRKGRAREWRKAGSVSWGRAAGHQLRVGGDTRGPEKGGGGRPLLSLPRLGLASIARYLVLRATRWCVWGSGAKGGRGGRGEAGLSFPLGGGARSVDGGGGEGEGGEV
jgi:hypothetical protein